MLRDLTGISHAVGELVPIPIPFDDFREHLAKIRDVQAVVVKIVDIADFHGAFMVPTVVSSSCRAGSFVSDIKTIIGENPVILVANKLDILPKGAQEHAKRIENW